MENNSAIGNRKYLILGLLCFTWIINYFDKIAINVAAIPISKQFGLNESQVGLILSSFFLSYAIVQPIGGWLSDKFGSRKVILVSALMWSLFTIMTGWAWSFTALLVIRFLFGIGEGSYPSASTVAVAETFPHKQRARAKSVLTSATTIGGMLGSLISAFLITKLGWENMFVVLGVVGLAVCVILFFFLKPPAQEKKTAAQAVKVKVPFKKLLTKPLIWQMMLMYFGSSIVTWGMNSWMPTYLVKVRHLSMVSMGALSSIPALVAFVGVLVLGWLLDKKFLAGREKYVIMIGALISCLCIYMMFQAPSVSFVVFYQCLAALGSLCVITPALTMPLKYLPKEIVGSATGIVYFGGQVAGIIAPSLMGYMIQINNGSFTAAFWVMIVAMIVPFITGITLRTKALSTESENRTEEQMGASIGTKEEAAPEFVR
ncbi:MFS transporter [Paenibacillus sp. UNC451MF]|uniref:MFS transporter n=1 Tax=Paenibacillus sp. UNC451MF TaxID=1449063 RepID=UPI00068BBEE4|nr:MFS transporter [Paenibacillus sp. UNC451MF]